jgi:hypothetical protein
MSKSKLTILLCGSAVTIAAVAVVTWMLFGVETGRSPQTPDPKQDALSESETRGPLTQDQANTPPEHAEPDPVVDPQEWKGPHAPYYRATTGQERITYVQSLATTGDETWDSVFLWKLIRAIDGGAVAVAAMETVVDLAEKRGGREVEEAILRGLKAPSRDVRHAAIQAAKEAELPGTVAALTEYFETSRQDRPLTLIAIAHIPDSDAKSFVHNLAADQSTERDLRVQAIALLAVSQSEASRGLLQTLRSDPDAMISKTAEQALKAYPP